MKKINLLIALTCYLIVGCTESNTSTKELELQKRELDIKQKELDLKEKELAQKDKNEAANSQMLQNKTEKVVVEKKLSDEEYGEYSANLSGGQMPWYVTIKLIRNTNLASYIEATNPKYGYEPIESKGTFIVNDVSNDYKFATCKFYNGKTMKLKYSIKKKKWIVTYFDGNNLANEMDKI